MQKMISKKFFWIWWIMRFLKKAIKSAKKNIELVTTAVIINYFVWDQITKQQKNI